MERPQEGTDPGDNSKGSSCILEMEDTLNDNPSPFVKAPGGGDSIDAGMGQSHSRQSEGNGTTPFSIRDDLASGQSLREDLISGSLSNEAQHALMHMSLLRKGLVGSPIPEQVRDAIVNAPSINSGLRPILLNELYKLDSAPRASSSSDGQQESPSFDQAEASTTMRLTRATNFIPGATPSSVPGPAASTGGADGSTPPAKKVFTMKRNNVPERPSLSSLMNRSASSSSVSRAPFAAADPLPVSPEPARVMSDIILGGSAQASSFSQSNGATMPSGSIAKTMKETDRAGTISGILRGNDSQHQGVKRKRDGNPGAETQGSNLSPARRQTATSISSSVVQYPTAVASPGVLPSALAQLKTTGSQSMKLVFSHEAKEASTPSSQSQLSKALQPHSIKAPTQTAQPKAMRDRKSMPVYNLVKLSDNSRRGKSHTSIVDQRGAYSSSSTGSSDVEIPRNTSERPRLLTTKKLHEVVRLSDSSSEEDSETGGANDEIDLEESPQSAQAASSNLAAENGRPYNIWRLPNGREVPTHGALIPTGYQLHSDPENPWICPVRTCRVLFPKLESVGGHFNRGHRTELLNDNGDGTLSVVGHRSSITGRGIFPGIVVSKKPLNRRESPMLEPCLRRSKLYRQHNEDTLRSLVSLKSTPKFPEQKLADNEKISSALPDHMSEDEKTELVEKPNAAPSYHFIEHDEDAMTTWRLIYPHLKDTPFSPIPQRGYVPEMLSLPRVRDLQFNPHAMKKYYESRPQDVAAMIIQMTGKEAPESCKRCREGKGPFLGCVVISPDAPLHVRRQVTSCSNCFYKGNQTFCGELTKWHRKTYPEIRDHSIPVPPPRAIMSATSHVNSTEKSHVSPERRSERIHTKHPVGVSSPNPSSRSSTQVFQRISTADGEARRVRNKDQVGAEQARSSVVSQDNTLGLAMEDWEVAPGRIRNESSQEIENIAFSAAYLAHGEEVNIGHEVGFHVLVIKPGTTHRFQPAVDRLRLCSIATGKVKVKTLSQEFEVGPNGMFQVKPSTACVVENRLYGDATLHVTAMPYEFLG